MKTHPDHFGLESFEGLSSKPFDFHTSECVILGTQGGPKIWNVEIKFTYKYNELLKIALESLKRIRIERALGGRLTMASDEKAKNIAKSLPPPKKSGTLTEKNISRSPSKSPTVSQKSSSSGDNTTHSISTPGASAEKGHLRGRRRLSSWLGGMFGGGNREDKKTTKKEKEEISVGSSIETVPMGPPPVSTSTPSTSPVSSITNISSTAAADASEPLVSESIGTSETIPETKTGTFDYFIKSQQHKNLASIEPTPKLPAKGLDSKALKEMVEQGGQKIDVGTKASNHSAGISYSRFISEHGVHEVQMIKMLTNTLLRSST